MRKIFNFIHWHLFGKRKMFARMKLLATAPSKGEFVEIQKIATLPFPQPSPRPDADDSGLN